MKLSIVIPVKNEEQELPEQLISLKQQTIFSDCECIVADAFSTDRTRELASALGAVIVDGGLPGPGRNRGAEIAKGEWILFMDADARPSSEDWLEHCLNELKTRQLDLATCDLKPRSNAFIDWLYHAVYNGFTRITAHFTPHAPGSCIFVKRILFENAGGFDETVIFAEDMECVQRIVKQGGHFGVLNAGPVLVSVRRLKKDGYWTTAYRPVLVSVRRLKKDGYWTTA
ncbi:MAG: glycosyltransferase, partial [Candidatus Magasanikbacteria bacterium]|nr:glycosyltransferase [Candidatus Magasanikbacteria bacterium]